MLQPSDRDSQRFFARLLDTFEAAFEEPLNELRESLRAGAEGVGLARALLADLGHAPDGFILVLDDFHSVDDASEIVESVDTIVRGLPEAGQVVITGREPPALSMTRLLTSGAVFPLGIEDLRFTVTAIFWGDLPVKEIARHEGVTTVAIRKRLKRALGRLALALEEEDIP